MNAVESRYDYTAASARQTIYGIFEAAATAVPDKLALIEAGEALSYADLHARTRAVAAALRTICCDEPAVGLLLPHAAAFWTAILACLAAGQPYLALDVAHPPARNAGIIAASGIRTVISLETHGIDNGAIPEGVRQLDFAALALALVTAELPHVVRDPARPACILYTSGSTGRPKGIVNNEAALLGRVQPYVEVGGLNHNDRFLTLSSPCTIAGTREGLTALTLGAGLTICDLRTGGLGMVRRMIANEGVTVLNAVPSALRALMPADAEADPELRTLRVIRVGGETVFWSDIRQFRRAVPRDCGIIVGYSATEQTGTHWLVPDLFPTDGPFVPIGYPLPGNHFTIVGENGNAVAQGETGELIVKGPHVALGYFKDGRCEQGDILADPETPGSRMFYTGDLLRMHADNLFTFIGRKDRQAKINGQRIEPAEVEAALRACPDVADAAVITRRDGHAVWLEAFVVLSVSTPDSALASVIDSVSANVPHAMRPRQTHLLPAIPRLPSLKADMAALAALAEHADARRDAANAAIDSVFEKPEGDRVLKDVIDETWRAVLGRNAPLTISFEAAGGDSLKLLEFALLIERSLQKRLSFEAFSMDMRPSTLLDALTRPALPSNGEVDRPVVFACPGLYGDDLRFAALRLAMESRIRFVLLQYPDWSEMAAGDPGDVLLRAVVAQINDAAPTGPVTLLGYSYGGRVALMAAHRLLALGRDISLIGVIDTELIAPEISSAERTQIRLRHLRQEISGAFAFAGLAGVAGFLAARYLHDVVGAARARRFTILRHSLLSRRSSIVLDRWMGMVLRLEAAAHWRAQTLPPLHHVPTVLFRSEDHEQDAPEDLGWRQRCPAVQAMPIRGDHETMLDPDNRVPICEALLSASAVAA